MHWINSPFLNNWIALLIVIPMAAGILTTLLRGRIVLARTVGLLSLTLTAILSFALVLSMDGGQDLRFSVLGAWPAPYGIAIVFDGLSGTLLCIASVIALACYIHSFSSIEHRLERGWFHPLFHLLMMGVNFSFLTGDLFNLFVAFEIMLMASYALLCIAAEQRQIAQAYKYLVLNLLGSGIFVLTAGLIYGIMGTLNYADLARLVAEAQASGEQLPVVFQMLAVLLFVVFTIKAAVFPLWFWLPDTYHTLPTPIGALFAALLSKVGVYAILRLYPMIFATPGMSGHGMVIYLLPVAAATTMLIGILCACGAHDIRRILALVLMSHVGYLLFGISMMKGESLSAVLFYMSQEMVLMGALFLCTHMIEQHSGTVDITKMGGLARRAPWLATIFFVLSIGLIGVPPISGFYGKALLVREGFANGATFLTICTLVTAALTALALLRVWSFAFWSPARGSRLSLPGGAEHGPSHPMRPAFVGVGLLLGVTVAISLSGERGLRFTREATVNLLEPKRYVEAILGPGAWKLERAPGQLIVADRVNTGAQP